MKAPTVNGADTQERLQASQPRRTDAGIHAGAVQVDATWQSDRRKHPGGACYQVASQIEFVRGVTDH